MSTKKQKQSSNYIVQGGILAGASILVRIIGLIYRIPVTRILGPVGNSYYSAAYEVYSMMLLISSFSLPLAVSKLVSARLAKGRAKSAYKLFGCTMLFALVSGGAAALIVFFGAGFFSEVVVSTPESRLALQVLAPTILIVALMGCLRGYFQGLGSMVPTAISQIIEQIINAAVSIGAAWYLFRYGAKLDALLSTETAAYAYGAAGSTLGTGLGALAGFLFLIFLTLVFRRVMKEQIARDRHEKTESTGQILYLILATILPVILSTAVYNISGIIDQGIFKHLLDYRQYDSMRIDELWGIFSGEYKLLTNVPIAVASAMASSVIPEMTRARVNRDRKQMRKKTENSIRFVMVISIPCAVGMSVLAEPILTLLFGAEEHTALSASLLQMGSISVVLYGMSTLTNGILQGMNKMRLPVIHAAIACKTANTLADIIKAREFSRALPLQNFLSQRRGGQPVAALLFYIPALQKTAGRSLIRRHICGRERRFQASRIWRKPRRGGQIRARHTAYPDSRPLRQGLLHHKKVPFPRRGLCCRRLQPSLRARIRA